MTQPLVSVCIPTYNSELYLSAMLDSIVAQTYKNIEVIISDNCSIDNTSIIAKEYCDKYNWILHQQEINLGAGGNFNFLINQANGEFVAIYHADDIYGATIIEESVRILTSNTDIGMVSTNGFEIDGLGKVNQEYKFHNKVLKLVDKAIDFDDLFFGVLSNNNKTIFILTPTVIVRKKVYKECGLFEQKKYKSAGDYEMWLRIGLNNFKIYVINKPLFSYRIHENQGSQTEIRDNLTVQDIVIVYKNYLRFSKNKTRIILKILKYYLSFYIKKYIK